jgi:hypothetical protein
LPAVPPALERAARALLPWLDRAHRGHRALGWLLPLGAVGLWVQIVAASGRSPGADGPHALGIAMRLGQLLREGALGEFSWSFRSLLAPHPPGAYVPALLVQALMGPGEHRHLLAAGLVWLLIWDAGRRLGGGPLAGHLTLLWAAAGGLAWQQAESYGVDFVAAAAVAQALSWLAASEALGQRRAAFGWGAWMGAAFLVKYTAPFFLWAPCLIGGLWVLLGGRWRQLGWGLGGWAVVAGAWYLRRGPEVLAYATASNTASPVLTNKLLVQGSPWDPANLLWYPAVLADQVGLWGLGALGLALLLPRAAGVPRGARAVALFALVGGWLVLNQQLQRQGRYLLPALPLVGMLLATCRGRLLLAPVGALGLWGALQLYQSTDGAPPARRMGHSWAEAGQGWPFPVEGNRPVSEPPRAWGLPEGVALLAQTLGELPSVNSPTGEAPTVGLLSSDGGPGAGLVLYQIAQDGHRWHLSSVAFVNRQGPAAKGTELPTRGGASLFLAPIALDGWPSRHFDVLIAFVREGDTRAEAWLQAEGFTERASFPTQRGYTGRVMVSVGG